MIEIQKPIVLFDRECKFCNFWITLIQRQKAQHKFRYFPLQSPQGKEFKKKYEVSESTDSIIVIADQKAFDKSSAAFKIARNLGGFWNLTLVFWIIPKPTRDWMYDIIANNRHRFFKNRESCEIHN